MRNAYIAKKSTRTLVLLFATSLFAGCSSIATSYDQKLVEYDLGFGSDKPIHALELTLANDKNTLHSSGGGFSGGSTWEPNNPESLPKAGGFHVLAGKQFVPRTAHARWFSYQNQKFYEAEFSLSPTLSSLLKEYKFAYGENTSDPIMIFGFGANGIIKAALKVSCSYKYECGNSQKIKVIGSGIGKEASGDTKVFSPITKQLILEGQIPSFTKL